MARMKKTTSGKTAEPVVVKVEKEEEVPAVVTPFQIKKRVTPIRKKREFVSIMDMAMLADQLDCCISSCEDASKDKMKETLKEHFESSESGKPLGVLLPQAFLSLEWFNKILKNYNHKVVLMTGKVPGVMYKKRVVKSFITIFEKKRDTDTPNLLEVLNLPRVKKQAFKKTPAAAATPIPSSPPSSPLATCETM